MAYNQARTGQVRELLAAGGVTDAVERKMFGSIGFMVNGKLCIGVGDHGDHVMMVRIDPEFYDEALHETGASPAIMRGKERRGYVFLQADAVRTDAGLKKWVDLALAYNKKLTGKQGV